MVELTGVNYCSYTQEGTRSSCVDEEEVVNYYQPLWFQFARIHHLSAYHPHPLILVLLLYQYCFNTIHASRTRHYHHSLSPHSAAPRVVRPHPAVCPSRVRALSLAPEPPKWHKPSAPPEGAVAATGLHDLRSQGLLVRLPCNRETV